MSSDRCPVCGEEGTPQEMVGLVPLLCGNDDCEVFVFDPRGREKDDNTTTDSRKENQQQEARNHE